MSRRMSMGGGKSSALRDVSSFQNSRPKRASRRRMTMGGADMMRSETPKPKDRRTALEEWRLSKTRSHSRPSASGDLEGTVHKRARIQAEAMPLPPSSQPSPAAAATTAVDRMMMRKQKKLHKQQHSHAAALDDSTHSNNTSILSSSMCDADQDDMTVYSSGPRLVATPKGRRRRSMMIQDVPVRGGRTPLFSASQETEATEHSLSQPAGLSQLTVDTEDLTAVDTVESAGLKSRIQEMQQRIDQLEKEKMVLSMSKAPLEARFRQKEDGYIKDQNRLLAEIETLKHASRESDERHRDLEMQYEAVEEECKQLRMEVRKASSSINKVADNSAWSRQLQNDRDVVDLKAKLRAAEEEIDSIRLSKLSVEKEMHATKIELNSLVRDYNELENEYHEISKSTSDCREAEIKLEVLTTEHIATSAQLNAVCADLAATKARADATLEAKEEEHKKEIEQLHFEMSVLKARAAKGEDPCEQSMLTTDVEDEAVLKARIEERDRRIAELEAQLLKGEELRRQMHNRIQELRGNVRVFVRTRPFLPSDGKGDQSAIDVSHDGESLSIVDSRNSASHSFKFDKAFPPSAGQDNVFQEVSDFVQSALDGYHVCLFSYGQTGSGKTHTMQGSGNGAMRGIIPRAVEQILLQAGVLQNQKWDFKLSASFLEIYNEELKDLLVSMTRGKAASKNAPKLSIKRSKEGKSFVDGLTEVPIEIVDSDAGMEQLGALMKVAARARSVASTKMNAHSSRSHSVFMLHLRGYNAETGAEVHGALNLCDLAGSERLDRSGAGSDKKRLRETQAINKSLSCLGDVFNALSNGSKHVPYRNSKLTYMLQDCLSGDGKALMFVNLSPTTASSNESLCSLRFAQRVNQVELGKATKHVHYHNSKR